MQDNNNIHISHKDIIYTERLFGTGDTMSFGTGIVIYPFQLKLYFRCKSLITRLFNSERAIWNGCSEYPFHIWFRTGYAPIYIIGAIPVLNHRGETL